MNTRVTFQLLDLRSNLGLAFMDVVEVENSPGDGRSLDR